MTVGELVADSTDISARRTGKGPGSDAGEEGRGPLCFLCPLIRLSWLGQDIAGESSLSEIS